MMMSVSYATFGNLILTPLWEELDSLLVEGHSGCAAYIPDSVPRTRRSSLSAGSHADPVCKEGSLPSSCSALVAYFNWPRLS